MSNITNATLALHAAENGLSTGAKAGAVMGVVMLGLLFTIPAALYICLREGRRRKRSREETQEEQGRRDCLIPQRPTVEQILGTNNRSLLKDPLIPKRPTVEQILGIDKRSLLRDLPIYEGNEIVGRPSYLTAAPASVGNWYDDPAPSCSHQDQEECKSVDPWEVEYGPNPVMFPHLAGPLSDLSTLSPAPLESSASQSSSKGLTDTSQATLPLDLRRDIEVEYHQSDGGSGEFQRPSESSSIFSLDTEVASSSSSFTLLNTESGDDLSPKLTGSTIDSPWSKISLPMEELVFVPASTLNTTVYCQSSSVGMPKSLPSDIGGKASPDTELLPTPASKSPLGSSLALTVSSRPQFTNDKTTLQNHHNRKHNLRYPCTLCPAAFGLRKDLERHEHTVHKEHFKSEQVFRCTNEGCATPAIEFNRKDNFQRHVKRCEKAIAHASGKSG
ncbi:hypothetical protein P153DRAFT_430584 [Dothidotthia symphoricarpi CBS 119687]|uniref:C2H2-type domain-containing protein n=1 Tax=Dothidotthia symphoricarpi CBS 119687 TaxID=1392245 RepID=A0A6A6AEV8_9PLEO|nr:uncharacterized protein P153DRAFT_430584 [Dothidotthia symphoricarpi CBS 119687]KAF2130350.1 hypothetical protein P153DRAFT_430584 [Dothidotthia symphoricarpi CBS 119687]